MEQIIIIDQLFATADAEEVSFHYDGSDLVLSFEDWREIPYEIVFEDTVYIRWDVELDDERFRYDSPHEVLDSEMIKQRKLNPNTFHHYMICFNAASNLELISQKLKITKPA